VGCNSLKILEFNAQSKRLRSQPKPGKQAPERREYGGQSKEKIAHGRTLALEVAKKTMI
jgi:hypothetical protein